MRAHPAAEIFPLMEGAEYAALVQDIREHGLREPITLYEGKILDGRNRDRACRDAKIKPRFDEWKPSNGESPLDYVVSLNLKRRHLNESQRGMVGAAIKPMKAAEAKARQRGGRGGALLMENLPEAKGTARDAAAALVNVSGKTVDAACKVADSGTSELKAAVLGGKLPVSVAAQVADAPAEVQRRVAAAVVQGGMKPAEALRQERRRDMHTAPLPDGRYRVIYADPPWKYSDNRAGLEGYEKSAAEGQYPTMSVSELQALGVDRLAADDAVLFCWATFPLLPDALEVVRAWGFTYKTAFVWAKGRVNFGHYHDASAELLLVCTRGSGVPDTDVREEQVQYVAHPGKHSAKPEEFRALIERLYTRGPRIELFRRGTAPKGWKAWGNEVRDAA